jgi:glycosyltransferase involved in cell wall biosynthesis
MKPLLSICIPTYNRAPLLELALQSLGPQVAQMNGDVELIVSDNCSTDRTADVVAQAQRYAPVRYHRNDENIGVASNIILLTNELATGDFCWIIGDDDMVVQGKLAKVIGIIKRNRDLDYFFVNYSGVSIQKRNTIITDFNSNYEPAPNECQCRDFSERRLTAWEQILSVDAFVPATLFTAIVCHIFKRSMWCSFTGLLDLKRDEGLASYSSFDTVFPHVKIIARSMVGRPVYYIGDPVVLLGVGSQEWWKYFGGVMLVSLNQALDLYEELGVDKCIIRHLRHDLLSCSGPWVVHLLAKPSHVEDRRWLVWFLRRFWASAPLWKSVISYMGGLAMGLLTAPGRHLEENCSK